MATQHRPHNHATQLTRPFTRCWKKVWRSVDWEMYWSLDTQPSSQEHCELLFQSRKSSLKMPSAGLYEIQTLHSFMEEAAGVAWERIKAPDDYCPYHYSGLDGSEPLWRKRRGGGGEEGQGGARAQQNPKRLFTLTAGFFFWVPTRSRSLITRTMPKLASFSLPQSPRSHFLFASPSLRGSYSAL